MKPVQLHDRRKQHSRMVRCTRSLVQPGGCTALDQGNAFSRSRGDGACSHRRQRPGTGRDFRQVVQVNARLDRQLQRRKMDHRGYPALRLQPAVLRFRCAA